MLRRNFEVLETDLSGWSVDLVLPLRLLVYIGQSPKEREGGGKRYDRLEKITKRSHLHLLQTQ